MNEEASVAIVARMYDEASPQMQQLAKNTESVQLQGLKTTVALSALGSALSSVGGLLRQIDDPAAKMLSNTLQIASAVVMSATAFARLIPIIVQATSAMRSMAIVQTILKALSGPGGWAMLGIGAAVGIGATAGIMRATRQPVAPAAIPNQPTIFPATQIFRAGQAATLGQASIFPANQIPGAGNILEGRSLQGKQPGSSQTNIVQHYHIAGSVIAERDLTDMVRKNIVHTQQRNAGKSGIA
jgi:hypothetical protein